MVRETGKEGEKGGGGRKGERDDGLTGISSYKDDNSTRAGISSYKDDNSTRSGPYLYGLI